MTLATLILYFTLAYCALGIGLIAARYDLYNKEPWYMLVLMTALGAAGMYAAGQAQLAMIDAINSAGRMVDNTTLAIMAGVTEEVAKLGAVVLVALFFPHCFDEPLDGLVYGSFAGLGAALEESVTILQSLPITEHLPPQEPVRLAGHLVMGGICCYGLGLVIIRHRRAALAVIASLLAAVILHTLWDMAAFAAADHYRGTLRLLPWHSGIPVALMLVGMIAYRVLARKGARLTRSWLQVCDVHTHQCPAM